MVETLKKNYESIISELRQSLSWMDLVISNVSEGILVVGQDGRILFANDALARMVDRPRITLLGIPIWEALQLAADGKTLKEEAYRRVLTQNSLEELTGRYYLRNDEDRLTVDVTVSMIENMQQAVLVIRDVTRQLQNEQALLKERIEKANEQARRKKAEEDERLLQGIIDGTTAAVFLKDLQGRYLLANSRFKRMFGLEGKDIKGKTDLDVFAPDKAKLLLKHDDKVLETREPKKWEESIAHDGDIYTYVFLKYPLLEPDGTPHSLCGVLTDITERKKLEERKDDFINMASHELKTPLTSMKLFWEFTQKYIAEGELEKALHNFTRINDQLDKLTKLTDSLLNVSRIESGKLELEKEEFDLVDLVEETIETAQSTTSRHTIFLEAVPDRQQVVGDKYRIGQVVLNLLTNAIKYSPNGESINVTVKNEGDKVAVSVQDFGIGISEEYQEKVFDRFYRVATADEKDFPGLGLGLYISAEIIRRHGGTMQVQSKKGEGATFLFRLPVS